MSPRPIIFCQYCQQHHDAAVCCSARQAMQQPSFATLSQYQANAINAQNFVAQQAVPFGMFSAVTSVAGFGQSLSPFSPPAPLEPPKPLETGMKVEDLIGWRIWMVKGDYLASYSADRLWMPDEPMTGVPTDHGHEGVWAFKKKEDAVKKMLQSGNGYALGSVKLWGHVIEHTSGFRAENARILTIDDAKSPIPNPHSIRDIQRTTDWVLLATLREKYGVPGAEEAKAAAATTPPPMPLSNPGGIIMYDPNPPKPTILWWPMWAAMAFNLAMGTWNLVSAVARSLSN